MISSILGLITALVIFFVISILIEASSGTTVG